MSKKTFKGNPALNFITPTIGLEQPEENVIVSGHNSPPMKPNPMYIETRSKRLNLLMQPSLHAKIKTLANKQGISTNELIHKVLEDYAERESNK